MNTRAGSKAFIVNRVGDLGFLVGTLLLFWSLAEAGTPGISFQQIKTAMPVIEKLVLPWPALLGGGEIGVASVLGLCFFVAACGKSAQLPLFVWLPDAMAGPTPVSALIHAATMVTAGVYLIARLSFLYLAAPEASALIAWTGALTALGAALVACVQTDIKRVLAYSTISQLGYMFLAAGAGAHTAAIFHVVAHAFFKALLFMVAGAMILALHHEQDMRRMGGVGSRMPLTRYCMFFGALTMAGVPGGAGFFSKEQILLAAHSAEWLPGHEWLYAIAMGTVAVTAFYSIRLIYLPLYGESHVPPELRREIHDPGPIMLGPMVVLAALCLLGSFIGTPQLWGELLAPGVEDANSIHHFLKDVVALPAMHEPDASEEWGLTGRALMMTAIGALPAVVLYLYRPEWTERIEARLGFLQRLLANAFYVDALYQAVIVRPLLALSDRVLSRWLDSKLIDGFFVMGSANAVWGIADTILKRAHSGLTQAYLITTILGGLAILAWLLFARSG